ncbi:MAG TPA: IPT/TIG domain-containing protein [Mycobacterium sp.]|nr:IPT/TIG domain-containing protein [Mycobacterium sp.]
MPVPPQCQTLVDEIDQLEAQIVEVGELVGEARWQAVAKNLNIQQQIANKQQKLKACLIAFGGFSTQVVVLNLTAGGGGAVTQPLSGTLWRLSAVASPVENQTVQSSQGGQLSFVNGPCDPLGALLAISVDEAPNATFTGPLFRSGAMETLYDGAPGNPTGAITIVIPGPIVVTAAQVAAAFAAAKIPAVANLTITSITPTVGTPAGSLTLTIAGVALGVLPLTYNYVCTVVPSRSMTAVETKICTVVAAPGTIASASLAGAVTGSLVGTALFEGGKAAIEPLLRAAVTVAVEDAVNTAIATAAANALGRPLTTFETISMRRVVITASGITLFPTIGIFGP